MEAVLKSALKAVDDLRAPGMIKLFLMCLVLTALAAALVISLGIWGAQIWIAPTLAASDSWGWAGWIVDFFVWGALVAILVLPMFLVFWSLMIFIASFFDEHIARKIEEFRYPQMAMGTDQPFWREVRQDILFIIKTILLNVVLLIPIFWPFWPILFPALNAYLLGTYFFMMAGGRHVGKQEARVAARKHRLKVMGAGLLIVLASGIPIVNLVVPFWGVAMMVHLYHHLEKPPIVEQLEQV